MLSHIESTSNNRIIYLILFLIVTFITLSLLHCVLIKVILEGKFSDIENSFTDLVSNFIDQYAGSDASSSSSFLWREEDEISGSGNSSVLGLKATGCSPHTYR